MPLRALLSSVTISPKVSFWTSIIALVIVLINNHVYLSSVQAREQELRKAQDELRITQDGLVARERTLKLWEMQMLQREQEVRALIRSADKQPR